MKNFELLYVFHIFVHFCVFLSSPLTDASRWEADSFLGGSRTGFDFVALKKKFILGLKQCLSLRVLK